MSAVSVNECAVLIVYCSSHFAAGKSVVDRAMAKAKKAAAAAPAASASEDTGERPAFALTSLTSVFERLCIFFLSHMPADCFIFFMSRLVGRAV